MWYFVAILTFLALPHSSLKFGRDVAALMLPYNSYNKVYYDVFYIALQNKYEHFYKVLVHLRNRVGSVVVVDSLFIVAPIVCSF